MDTTNELSQWLAIVWVTVGIIISLILPIVVKVLNDASIRKLDGTKPTLWEKISKAWNDYNGKKYLLILGAAFVVAIVVVFLLGLEFDSPREAALGGFAWESLVNKLFGSKS